MSARRVLAIFAHPDDESLLAGGTLAALAAAGLEVAVVSATSGEQGPIARPDLATPETLGATREAELRAAAAALGLSAVECLGYPDGELAGADATTVEADLARTLRRWRPAAVITFGPEGLYWHPDHVAVHECATAALDALNREGLAPWVYHATWPAGWTGALVAAMAARGLPAGLWGLHPDDFGAPAESITTALDVRAFLAPKLRALRSHRSQLTDDLVFRAVPNDLAREFLGREYFALARRGGATGDWLAEILARGARTELVTCSGGQTDSDNA